MPDFGALVGGGGERPKLWKKQYEGSLLFWNVDASILTAWSIRDKATGGVVALCDRLIDILFGVHERGLENDPFSDCAAGEDEVFLYLCENKEEAIECAELIVKKVYHTPLSGEKLAAALVDTFPGAKESVAVVDEMTKQVAMEL